MTTTELTESARLYLADIDVLEEAREQLDGYFLDVWRRFQTITNLAPKILWEHAGKTWNWWNGNTLAGRCTYFSLPGLMFQLGVCDPFVSDHPRVFMVWLHCSKKDKNSVEATVGTQTLIDAARGRGLALDLADVTNVAWTSVPVEGGADDIAGALAAALRGFADHALALEDLVRDRNPVTPVAEPPA